MLAKRTQPKARPDKPRREPRADAEPHAPPGTSPRGATPTSGGEAAPAPRRVPRVDRARKGPAPRRASADERSPASEPPPRASAPSPADPSSRQRLFVLGGAIVVIAGVVAWRLSVAR